LERVRVEPISVLGEPRLQPSEVRRTALAAADRVELEVVTRDAESCEKRVVELDQLRVDCGVVTPHRLDRRLPVLAQATSSGCSVPVHRRDGEELRGLRLAV
jgi:hypothetical protein